MCYNFGMSELLPFGIIALAGLAHASLQLGLGCLLLLYHGSLGRHVKSQTKALVGSFVSGMGMMVLVLICAFNFVILSILEKNALPAEIMSAIIGVLIATSLVMWFFYYRRGHGTELWIPKSMANFLEERANSTEDGTEAFSLGLMAGIGELPFSLVLMILASNSVLEVAEPYQGLAIALYTVLSILPLIILRLTVRKGKTVADIQRWRTKNKTFLRIVSGLSFLTLGIFLLAFKVLVDL